MISPFDTVPTMKNIFFVILIVLLALRAEAKPPAPGPEIAKGHFPTVCSDGDFTKGAYYDEANFGYYYSKKKKKWLANAWCYPRWGYLKASSPQIVAPGQAITIVATPTDGSNSATYAPMTNSIFWSYPGDPVSGCTSSDLTCTFIPFRKRTKNWQWDSVQVSMPRTFFIDSPGSLCQGQHICAGFETYAWTFVGTPPCGKMIAKEVFVKMQSKSFLPGTIFVDAGTKVTMCNDDQFPQFPYSPDKHKWGHTEVASGACTTFKVPDKEYASRATFTIYDERHTNMELKIIVLPNKC